MEISRRAIKYNARGALKAARPHNAYLVTLAYLALDAVIYFLVTTLMSPFNTQEYITYISAPVAIARSALYTALMLIMSILGAGFAMYCFRVSRYLEAPVGALFDGFGMFFRIIGLHIVQGFFVFLWSLLLIVPGIIAGLRYSQAFYIMLDHPEYSIMQCIRESKRLMDGRKGEYFVLQLSFIGWVYLSLIPGVAIFVMPYMTVTMVNYYNALAELDWKNNYSDPGLPPQGPGFGF